MKTLEQRVAALESRLDAFFKSQIQQQKNMTPITAKAEQAESDAKALTPTTYIQTAYIGDIELIFYDVKRGNTSVFFECEDNCNPSYTMERYDTTVAIYFTDELECVTTVTLSVV